MKRSLETCITAAFLYLSISQVFSSPGSGEWKLQGKAIFKTHRAVCHQEDERGILEARKWNHTSSLRSRFGSGGL